MPEDELSQRPMRTSTRCGTPPRRSSVSDSDVFSANVLFLEVRATCDDGMEQRETPSAEAANLWSAGTRLSLRFRDPGFTEGGIAS